MKIDECNNVSPNVNIIILSLGPGFLYFLRCVVMLQGESIEKNFNHQYQPGFRGFRTNFNAELTFNSSSLATGLLVGTFRIALLLYSVPTDGPFLLRSSGSIHVSASSSVLPRTFGAIAATLSLAGSCYETPNTNRNPLLPVEDEKAFA